MLVCAEPWSAFRSAWILIQERLTRMFEWTVFYLLRIFEKRGALQMPNPNSCQMFWMESSPCQMICKGGVEPPMFAQGLLCFLNGALPFLANCLFPLKSLARMAWFLETVLLPRQLLLASLMHLSRKHLDEGYAVGSCLVKRQLQILAAPPPSPMKSMRCGQCSGGAYCL